MHWNCPHCDTTVTADLDFESKAKTYVRCASCEGLSIIHRSATVAEAARTQRLELEAKMRAAESAIITSEIEEFQIASIQDLNLSAASIPMPPPFHHTYRPPMVTLPEETPAPAARQYAQPPAFLLERIDTSPHSFATHDSDPTTEMPRPAPLTTRTPTAASNFAVWIAALLALASGIYLFNEGKKALAPEMPLVSSTQTSR